MADRKIVSGTAPDRARRAGGGRAGRRGRGICQRQPVWQQRAGRTGGGRRAGRSGSRLRRQGRQAKAVGAAADRRGRRDAAGRPAAIAVKPRLQWPRRQADDARRAAPARRCCSICGRPGARPAAPKCRRSTRCRRTRAATASRSSPSMSTPATTPSRRSSCSEIGVEDARLLPRQHDRRVQRR